MIARSGVTIAVAALLGATLSVALPASATPPSTPTSPMVSQPDVTTAQLTWQGTDDSTRFEVMVDDSADFTSPVVRQTTTNTTYTPNVQLPTGTLYWRVRAINASNESSGWLFSQFTQGRVGKPQLAAPADQARLGAGATPVLSWAVTAGATDYSVEVSRESSFTPSNTKVYTTQSTSVVPSSRLARGVWFWRVTASRANGLTSDPSDPRTFEVLAWAGPNLLTPTNSTAVPVEDVVLKWTAAVGAKSYEIDISRDRDFPSAGPGVKNGPDWVTMPRENTVATSYSPTITLDNAVTWYWRVRSIDRDGNTSDWQVNPFVFRRAWGDISDGVDAPKDLADIPTLVEPAAAGAEILTVPFAFTWTAAQHASDYEINVGTDPAWSPSTFSRCRVHGTTYTPQQFRVNVIGGGASEATDDKCNLSPGIVNYWRVRALDRPFAKSGVLPGVQGEFSATQAFTWRPAAMTNFKPVGGATVTTPTVSWEAVTGAETYEVSISGSGTSKTQETNSTSYTLPTRPNTLTNPYTWSVRAIDAAGNPVSMVHTSMTFNLSEAPGQASWQNLTATGATLRAPDLRWAPITGADHYRVQVRRPGEGYMPAISGSLIGKDVDFPALTDTSDRLFAEGAYLWRVEAYDEDDVPLGNSPEWSFTIAALADVVGQKIALTGASLSTANTCSLQLDSNGQTGPRCTPMSATPTLSWDKVPGASLYQVWVNTDASFTTPMEPESKFPATSNTMYVPNLSSQVSAFPDNDAQTNSAYYWAIVPCKSVRSCASSIRGELGHATNAFVKKSPPVELQLPADQATVTASDLTFSWSDYLATNRVSTSASGEMSHQSAMLYRIQVSTDQDFNSILESVVVDQPTYTSADSLYPDGPLYWRVRAIDGDDNELTWSPTWRVNKQNPIPTLVTPAAGAVVGATTTFSWSDMGSLSGFEVQVYKNGQVSPTNLVCSVTGNSAARYPGLACPKPFAPTTSASGDDYLWRVRRIDSTGLANPWTATSSFDVSPNVLSISGPGVGALQAPNRAVLSWLPVPGAKQYQVEMRNDSAGQNLTPVTTVATSYAPTTDLASGTYTWKVTAFDAAGGAMATATSTFVVDAALGVVTPASISAPDGSAVGQTLVGTPPVWTQPGVTNAFQWLRNGSSIAGATGSTYTLTTADYTKTVSLRVTGSKPGYTDGTSVSNQIAVTAGGALQIVGIPTISGSATPGGSLAVTSGSWSPAATKVRYQWLRSGVPIPSATGANYRMTSDDAGRDISATVFASATGFNEGAATAAAVSVARLKSAASGVLKSSRVKLGKRAKLTVTVKVTGLTTPTGVVQVLDKGKKIAQFTMAPVHLGKKTLKLRKLPKGKHPLQVVYVGNGQTYGSKSKKIVLFMVK